VVQVVMNNKGKIRDKPISAKLTAVLIAAAEAAGVDKVSVVSGGQDVKGQGNRRTGSTRHDGGQAADIQLIRKGRVLDFHADRAVFEAFVTAAAAAGATGMGAGDAYMGPKTIHVGFGTKLIWGGAKARAADAPAWMKKAAEAGWNGGKPPKPKAPAKTGLGKAVVNARGGLRLRGGPGTEFATIQTLVHGADLTVVAFDEVDARWALVDLEDDGRIDGYVFAALLTPVDEGDD
jgi:hypothetical protein